MSDKASLPENRTRYLPAQRLTALIGGIACHLLFAAAIIAMALALFNGMRIGMGSFRGWPAAMADLGLMASFPLVHSWLLTPGGRRMMNRLVPFGIGEEMSSTVFAAIASVQLLAVFLLWSPTGMVWWESAGWARFAIGTGAAGSWLLLAKAMSDSQLSLQTGFLGWSSVFNNRIPVYRPFAQEGLYRHVRQPIYISFALILWFAADWTPDQLVMALGWTGYCLVGAILKERRYLRYFGESFRHYRARVPFLNPLRKPVAPARPETSGVNHTVRGADVVISGAGPVGLYLANLLGRRGYRVLVIERRRRMTAGSLAIGITPPTLCLFRSLGLDDLFMAHGVRIDTARVFENREELGELDFSGIPAEHRFILSLPQSRTVALLRDNLRAFPGVQLLEGVEVVGHQQTDDFVSVELRDTESGVLFKASADFLVGTDGHRSRTRVHAGFRWRERSYRPCFLMADFDDDTTWGREARLFFGPSGSVESFPLPDGLRRWIVQTDHIPGDRKVIGSRVADIVRKRVGVGLPLSGARFQSSFRPRRGLAREFFKGRVILCGDAAHVMSPIGGQGMNTGMADAAHLDRVLGDSLENREVDYEGFAAYHRARRRAFRVAADRAARGMWLGTRVGILASVMRRLLISRILLGSSFRERLAPDFAMLTIPGFPPVADGQNSVGREGR
ncbi:MAG: FAD-dependent monooxygenase [Opitutaceae bacterium]